ncbi:uncharacterized protein LOC107640381 [Arachis ipaensis]|uniref:uncharacterized protein LOC107640381 n=1 Tax=Arachis ipaensis TaxID=130454 RepID=UPI0007AF9EEE|nr:uncharacterized protein LOC107640381 [Arachis ipaensis]
MGEDKRSTATKDSPIEELKEIRAHEETIEVPLNALLQIIESEEYSSSDKEEKTREEQVARYLEILMKLNAKFCGTEALKEEPPVLTQECSALVQRKLPQKRPDPRSFLIPCIIGTITFQKALCDLGSSINLMPLSIMKRLEILEVQAAKISLEMADRPLKKAYGMVKDVLVNVEDLSLSAIFVILDTGRTRMSPSSLEGHSLPLEEP